MSLYSYFKGVYEKRFPPKRYYAKDLPYFVDKEMILDIGCGHGLFLESGPNRIIGLDQNPESVAVCKQKGLNCIQGSCLALPFDDSSIDGIYCSHIIEHLNWEDVVNLVAEVDRVLKHEGIIVLKTPLPSAHFYDDPTHVKPYSPSAILSLFGATQHGQTTFISNIGDYVFKRIRWDRDLLYRPLIPPSVDPKQFCLRMALRGASIFLAQFGIRRLRKDAYTLVLEKR